MYPSSFLVKCIFQYGWGGMVYSLALALSPLPSPPVYVYVYVRIHTCISENKEAVSDDEKSDLLGKKMGPVIANYPGCPRQGWRSDVETVLRFGEC